MGFEELAQPAKNASFASAGAGALIPAFGGGFFEADQGAVVEEDVQRIHMVYRIPVQNGMGACGVVANHAAERGAVAARGVWSRHQSAGRQRGVEAVQHQPGLYANLPRFLVYFQNAVKMLRKVDDQGFCHRLSGQGGPAAARQRRHAETSGFLDRRLHVVHRARNQHGARLHTVDAGVGRVQRPRHLVEKQLARNAGRKRMPKVLQGVVHAGL